jgi:hypothetical protein
MPADYLKYTIGYTPITENIQFAPGLKCNAVNFINQGTAVCTIDNMIVLQQGQSFSIDGNIGEIISGKVFNLTFTGANIQLVVVAKRYI